MVHFTSTLQPQSVRLPLALVVLFGFIIWTADILQAYLQAGEPLGREIHIAKPPPKFELTPGQCVKVMRPLYDLCDSGDLWHKTLDHHYRRELSMIPSKLDPALHIFTSKATISGLSGSYFDDLLPTGTPKFRTHYKRNQDKFEMTDECVLPAKFTCFVIDKDKDGFILIEQNPYLRKLETIPLDAAFTHFRSMCMRLAWLFYSHPECLFEISQLA